MRFLPRGAEQVMVRKADMTLNSLGPQLRIEGRQKITSPTNPE